MDRNGNIFLLSVLPSGVFASKLDTNGKMVWEISLNEQRDLRLAKSSISVDSSENVFLVVPGIGFRAKDFLIKVITKLP